MTDTTALDAIPPEVKAEFFVMRALDDGRVVGIHRLAYTWSLQVDIDWVGYRERYCYATLEQALIGFTLWDGTGDPPGGWHRHPESGRRRPDGDAAREYINL